MNSKERLFLIDELIKVFTKASKTGHGNQFALNCAVNNLNNDKNNGLYKAITIDGFPISDCKVSSRSLYSFINEKLYNFMKKHDPIFGSIYKNNIMLNITDGGEGRIYYSIKNEMYFNTINTLMEDNIPIPKKRMSYTTFRTYIKKYGK